MEWWQSLSAIKYHRPKWWRSKIEREKKKRQQPQHTQKIKNQTNRMRKVVLMFRASSNQLKSYTKRVFFLIHDCCLYLDRTHAQRIHWSLIILHWWNDVSSDFSLLNDNDDDEQSYIMNPKLTKALNEFTPTLAIT